MYGAVLGAFIITVGAITGFGQGPTEVAALDGPRIDYGVPGVSARSAEAMELVGFDWETTLPGWTIDFVEGETEIAGYTWSNERRIEIFVRSHSTPESLHRVLAHEFGHAVDVSLNSANERRSWLTQRNAEGLQWWPNSGKADFQTGAGDFAETFAVWMTGNADDFRSEVGPVPSADDLALIDQLLADA